MGAIVPRGLMSTVLLVAASLGGSTAIIFILGITLGVREASAVYLLAVAVVAIRSGTFAAIGTSALAFLLYNFLFVEPRFTLAIASSESVVTLLLLLALGILIAQLAGAEHDRAVEAGRSAEAARLLSVMSSKLARAKRAREALPDLAADLASSAHVARLWIGLGPTVARETVVADTSPGPTPSAMSYFTLRQEDTEWVRLSLPTQSAGPAPRRQGEASLSTVHRIEISDGSEPAGSIWFIRPLELGRPTTAETTLLRAAVDQIGQAIRRDQLADQATDLEIAVRSDELKSALLDSVSHDLRTPLASIRATAGNLADEDLDWAPELRRSAARQIDAEAERLSRLVGALLDMSRIRGGTLHPQFELIPSDELVRGVLDREAARLVDRRVDVEVGVDAPILRVDPVFADQVVANLVDNVLLHAPPTAPLRITVSKEGEMCLLTVEDGGAGVPPADLPRLFDPFVRGSRAGPEAGGAGLGLAVVRGLTDAMGGSVTAHPSVLGGLAVDVRLPAASRPLASDD